VEYAEHINREVDLDEYRGYVETTNNRMELRGRIFSHEWAFENLDDPGGRVLILTDSTYVHDAYSYMLRWCQNDYRSIDGRPIKNPELLKELMTIRRKLTRRMRVEVKLISRRSDEGAKEVDRMAKEGGRNPTYVDRGFKSGKIGRPRNNAKGAAKLYPAAGQVIIIRPYKSGSAAKDVQIFKFEVWHETKRMFFDKFEAYASPVIGNELHRQNVYEVRMNDTLRYPQIVEILWTMKEKKFLAQKAVGGP
jgi:ribonuclease HI